MITANVLRVYDYLIIAGIVSDKIDFCRRIGFYPNFFEMVLNGETEFPVEKVNTMIRVFNVNVAYIISGRGNMLYKDRELTRVWMEHEDNRHFKVDYVCLENIKLVADFVKN